MQIDRTLEWQAFRYRVMCDHKQLTQTNKNVSFDKNSKGLILKIGNRKSNHYSRIYEGRNYLKFDKNFGQISGDGMEAAGRNTCCPF